MTAKEETQQIFRQSETLLRNAYDALGVPRDALALDVLKFRYRRGKKRLKPRGPRLSEMLTKAAKPADYLNVERQAYIADGCLCLADPYQVLAIPLEEIQGICLLKKPLQLPRWNKAVHYTQPPYGAYQIKSIGFGLLQVPNAYQLTIRHSGETYQLLVPAYEQAVLKRLLPAAFQA